MNFVISDPDRPDATAGLSYAGMFVRAGHDAVLAWLGDRRFTGWLGPQEGDWVLVVAEQPDGPVAGEGRTLLGAAAEAARDLSTVALAVRVRRDVVLHLDGWDGTGDDGAEPPRELGGYVSDPSGNAENPDEVYPEPEGAHHAQAYAAACGQEQAGADLFDLLAEELDTDSVFESERLDSVLRLLDLPRWLISAASLPKDVPAGPRRSEVVRLGAGRTGAAGRVISWILRRRRR